MSNEPPFAFRCVGHPRRPDRQDAPAGSARTGAGAALRAISPFDAAIHRLDLAKLTESTFTEAVTFTLDNAEYEASYRGGDKPRRLRIESKYGLCFRNCLLFFILEAAKRAEAATEPPKLHFVLESGHKNWSEVRDIFNDTKREVKSLSGYDLLGNITFADKDQCDPLMMADFLAHAAYMTAHGDMPAVPNEQPFLEREPPQLPPGQSGVTNLRYGPGALSDLKIALAEKLKAKGASAKRPVSEGQSS